MRNLASLPLVSLIFWPLVAGVGLCPSGCASALSYVVFNGSTTTQQCTNQLHIISYYTCLRQYCPEEAQKEYVTLAESCKGVGAIPAIADVTVDLQGLARITSKDLYKKVALTTAVKLDPSLYDLSTRTITSAKLQDEINIRYGHAMYGFWALTMLLSGLVNLCGFILGKVSSSKPSNIHNTGFWRTASAKLKRHVTIPALAGNWTGGRLGWWTIPPRLQSLTIIAFGALNLALCISRYDVFLGNLKRPSIPSQITRLIGRRTGVIIMANLPLMWTFAMRNNILSWFSGWGFATFNNFHRWIARIVMAELVAHAVAYSLSEYYSGGLKKYYAQWPQGYWWWGIVAIIAGSFATASAIYPIRQRFYDAFLLTHIVLATLFLVGTWFHIKKQDNDFDFYFWPCIAVWAVDRVIRFGRVLALNRSVGRAQVVYDQSSDMLHLEIPARSFACPRAGTYYYVYIIHGFKFWESHPFTLSSWEKETGQDRDGVRLKFLIRPLDGFTGRLRDFAIQNTDAEGGSRIQPIRSVLALVEGPYGSGSRLDSYGSLVFVVGGSGISVVMSHLQNLNDIIEQGQNVETHKAHIIWAVRSPDLASGVLDNHLLPWLATSKVGLIPDLRFDIYVTSKASEVATPPGMKGTASAAGSSIELTGQSKTLDLIVGATRIQHQHRKLSEERVTAAVQFYTGRPPLKQICQDYAHQDPSQSGKIALVCCGPPTMADEVRSLVVDGLSTKTNNLDFFLESFSW